jgi:integrase
VRRLRTADLDLWYAQLRRSGRAGGLPLAPNSVGRIHGLLRRALNQGVRWGWLTSNPAVAASPPRIHRHSLEIPSAVDVTRLISAAALIHPALPVFLRLAATTGARRGELCALRWRHLDLHDGILHIAGALVQVKRDVIEKSTKTHAERRVTIDEGTIRVVTDYRTAASHLLAFGGLDLSPDAFVFSHRPDGLEPWRPNYVTLAFGRLARRHGMAGLRLHDLRHFAATIMLTGGVDIRTAAGRLGHAQSSTTLDIYAHFVQLADQRAAATLGTALDGPSASSDDSSPISQSRTPLFSVIGNQEESHGETSHLQSAQG